MPLPNILDAFLGVLTIQGKERGFVLPDNQVLTEEMQDSYIKRIRFGITQDGARGKFGTSMNLVMLTLKDGGTSTN